MAVNSGLPVRPTYSAYNTSTNEFVAGDEGNHTLTLVLNGAALPGSPVNGIIDLGDGVYELNLTDAERTGTDLVIIGTSSAANIIIVPMHYTADIRWNELLEDDGGGNLRNTAKSLEQGPVANVSGLALEASVQTIITTGGSGPWTRADVSNLALEASVQTIINTGGSGPWTRADVSNLALEASVQTVLDTGGEGPWTTGGGGTSDVNVISWQGVALTGTAMIQNAATDPKWTALALSLAPSGGGGDGSVTYVNRPTEIIPGYLNILRGDTLNDLLLMEVNTTTVSEIIFAVKRSTEDSDADSLLYISSISGLLFINGEPAPTAANGSVERIYEMGGLIRIVLAAEETAKLPEMYRSAIAEIQLKTDDVIYTPYRRNVNIVADVVRAV